MAKAVKETASSTRYSDITLSTGLTFSTNASNNTVKLYNVLGSTTNKGLYYVKSRTVYWNNPGSGYHGTKYPTTTSWNYSITDNWGAYVSQVKPYSILDAVIGVSGQGGQKTLSVGFYLDAG